MEIGGSNLEERLARTANVVLGAAGVTLPDAMMAALAVKVPSPLEPVMDRPTTARSEAATVSFRHKHRPVERRTGGAPLADRHWQVRWLI